MDMKLSIVTFVAKPIMYIDTKGKSMFSFFCYSDMPKLHGMRYFSNGVRNGLYYQLSLHKLLKRFPFLT